jgi:hypothetical protein
MPAFICTAFGTQYPPSELRGGFRPCGRARLHAGLKVIQIGAA